MSAAPSADLELPPGAEIVDRHPLPTVRMAFDIFLADRRRNDCDKIVLFSIRFFAIYLSVLRCDTNRLRVQSTVGTILFSASSSSYRVRYFSALVVIIQVSGWISRVFLEISFSSSLMSSIFLCLGSARDSPLFLSLTSCREHQTDGSASLILT